MAGIENIKSIIKLFNKDGNQSSAAAIQARKEDPDEAAKRLASGTFTDGHYVDLSSVSTFCQTNNTTSA